MIRIACLAIEGCLFSGTIGLMDAFGIANLRQQARDGSADPLFETAIVTSDGQPVKAQGNIHIQPHKSLADTGPADVILVPPLLPDSGPWPQGIENIWSWLEDRHKRGALIATFCTGTFVLAETGLLNGRRATTNWMYARRFQQRCSVRWACYKKLSRPRCDVVDSTLIYLIFSGTPLLLAMAFQRKSARFIKLGYFSTRIIIA